MTKKQKKDFMKVALLIIVTFIALVIFIPMFSVEAVELGAEPTLWQNVHGWFADVKDFFIDTWGVLMLVVVIALGGYYFIKKK